MIRRTTLFAARCTAIAALALLASAQQARAQRWFGTNAVQIAAGADHTCVINGCGLTQCWGRNDFGQTNPPAGLRFDSITAGMWHTCGIRSDNGQVACWGRSGPLLSAPATQFDKIDAGYLHTCGLRSDGGVECWGYDWNGSVFRPPSKRVGLTTMDMSAGTNQTCAAYDDLTVNCVGQGPLNNPVRFQTPPLQVGWGPPDQISSGTDFSCVITGGLLQCFGANNYGQSSGLGGDPSFPALEAAYTTTEGANYSFGAVEYLEVSAGLDHACAIVENSRSAGPLRCWGRGHNSSNGGTKTPLPSGDFVQVASGRDHMCAINDAGRVSCVTWATTTAIYNQAVVPTIGCQLSVIPPPAPLPLPIKRL